MVTPYLASISRRGTIASSGLSICCSTLRSARPSIPLTASLMSLPRSNRVLRSSPNILTAIAACVPESMASIRCDMGWPISTLTPGRVPSFSRSSAMISLFGRPPNSNGASISEVFTPSACSSSSARPVLRATVFISGTESISSSALRPIASLSSSETPGSVLTLIVNEPSLNGGRKLEPKPNAITTAPTSAAADTPSTALRWCSAAFRALP